ncbi:MAG: hypothetical protein WC508_04770 [Patescibacteria group bacterium]
MPRKTENTPRFGQEFNIDDTNRLNPFAKEKDLPEYLALGKQARAELKQSVETVGWPEVPSGINDTADLFTQAKEAVDQRWSQHVSQLIEQNCAQWSKDIPRTEETEEILKLLSNPALLEEKLKINQFTVLEGLREVAPQAWRSLVYAASERQLASVVLLNHWAESMSAESIQALGVNREELKLFLSAAGILGKYVDSAYVKQIELADQAGGKSKTALGDKTGAGYVYDVYRSKEGNDIEVKPYTDVFPFEWPKIVTRFEGLAKRTEALLSEGKLPESYQGLPAYLRQMANTYGSQDITPESLDEKWEDLYAACRELATSSCPIMLIPQGCDAVAGDAAKVDAELRLGFRTKKAIELEKYFDQFKQIAEQILSEVQTATKSPDEVPKVLLNYQPFAFGPNLYYFTPAESGEEIITSHTNAVEDLAMAVESPLVQKVFGQKINTQQYRQAATLTTNLHELAHAILQNSKSRIIKRIGKSNEAWILEELKAEAVGAEILNRHLKSEKSDLDPKTQFLTEMGVVCGYIANNSKEKNTMGARYYYTGITIISRLLESGIIRKTGNHYEIADPQAGIATIAQIGNEILQIYSDPEMTPKKATDFAKDLKAKENDAAVQDFLAVLKS